MALYKYVYYFYYYYFMTPLLNSQGMKDYAMQCKKVQNQAGMNLTSPPSQNSGAVMWHCTAESKQSVAGIGSCLLSPN